MSLDLTQRAQVAKQTAEGLKAFADRAADTRVLVGFDGFVDSIIAVVDKRQSLDDYSPLPTIESFGNRIVAASGQSSNFELVVKLEKLGGNGPIMANALALGGTTVDYLGCLGAPAIHSAFAEFQEVATCHSVTEPGYTDAVEFDDGKLMMGKYDHMARLDADQVIEALGIEKFTELVTQSSLIGMVNWTMMPVIETVWAKVAEVLSTSDNRPMIFIDLADPAKRTDDDIRGAMRHAGRMQEHADVVLGLNLSEAMQIVNVLGLDAPARPEEDIQNLAKAIREELGLHACVVHPRKGAAASMFDGSQGCFWGPFVEKPKLSTGAGDNFNAGFCLGLLAGLPVDQALCCGTATSGFYVREARSPKLEELIAFCEALPAPQGCC